MQSRMMVLMRPGEEGQLAAFASELWHDAYDSLIGGEQVDYMMRTIQSEEAIRRQIERENYIYFFLFFEGARAGYCALKPEKERLFLSKLYLSEKFRGRGLGQRALGEVADCARRLGLKNRHRYRRRVRHGRLYLRVRPAALSCAYGRYKRSR